MAKVKVKEVIESKKKKSRRGLFITLILISLLISSFLIGFFLLKDRSIFNWDSENSIVTADEERNSIDSLAFASMVYNKFQTAIINEDPRALEEVLTFRLSVWHALNDVKREDAISNWMNKYVPKWKVVSDSVVQFKLAGGDKVEFSKYYTIRSKKDPDKLRTYYITGYFYFNKEGKITGIKDDKTKRLKDSINLSASSSDNLNAENDANKVSVNSGRYSKNDSCYVLNVLAVKTENDALQEVSKLVERGYDAGYLWIPDFASLSGAKYFSVFIGPFATLQECGVQVEEYRKIDPSAYGLLVSQENKRVEIRGLGNVTTTEN